MKIFVSLCTTLLIATVLTFTGGCKTKTSDRDIESVNPQEAITLANNGPSGIFSASPNAIWLDPRSPSEFETAHIPGAVNIPFGGDFVNESRTALSNATVIIVYGTSSQDVLGTAASKRLIEEGISPIYTLRGGLRQWARDGNPVDGTNPDSVR
jgi:rhodanese-related sulfurtransferase